FIQWLFNDSNIICNNNTKPIIIFGHSSWIRTFFNMYLPKSSKFSGKKYNLENCSVIKCEISKYIRYHTNNHYLQNKFVYTIDEKSIQILYGNYKTYDHSQNQILI